MEKENVMGLLFKNLFAKVNIYTTFLSVTYKLLLQISLTDYLGNIPQIFCLNHSR